jgi:pimeloyl-ACP methyl ester carboxylesterase
MRCQTGVTEPRHWLPGHRRVNLTYVVSRNSGTPVYRNRVVVASSQIFGSLETLLARPEASRLVVTFSSAGDPEEALPYWDFQQFFSHTPDFAVLHVRDRNRAWFNDPDGLRSVAALVNQLRRQYGYTTVITLGVSMGGFGAILFARYYSIDHAIALAPQTVLHHDLRVYFDAPRPYMIDAIPHLFHDDLLDDLPSYLPATLISGSENPIDVWMIHRISHIAGVCCLCIPRSPHNIANLLVDTGMMATLLRSAAKDSIGSFETALIAGWSRFFHDFADRIVDLEWLIRVGEYGAAERLCLEWIASGVATWIPLGGMARILEARNAPYAALAATRFASAAGGLPGGPWQPADRKAPLSSSAVIACVRQLLREDRGAEAADFLRTAMAHQIEAGRRAGLIHQDLLRTQCSGLEPEDIFRRLREDPGLWDAA